MLANLKRGVKRLIPYYYRRVHCPLCGAWDHEFQSFGLVPRHNALCQACGSLERHRLAWLFFQRQTDLFDGKSRKMLHVAPEGGLTKLFGAIPNLDYLTADLMSPKAMIKMDITDIQLPDATFDVIYCSHVLEHVLEDRKAVREFRRVLKPEGWAVLVVPTRGEITAEDPSVTDPKDRMREYGEPTHVRMYGLDFRDRLIKDGFRVRAFFPTDVGDARDLARHGIPAEDDPIFLCTSAAPSAGAAS